MLEENHGVFLTDTRLQQPLRMSRCGRNHDAQSGAMQEIGFKALAMLCTELMARALRCAYNHRHLGVAAEHVMNLGGVVDDLIDREQAEIDRHQLDNWLECAHRGADSGADDREFRNRRVTDALFAVDSKQPVGDLECTAEVADLLAHDEYTLIAVEFLAQGLVERFPIRDLGHAATSLSLHVDVLAQLVERRFGALLGKLHCIVDNGGNFAVDLVQLGIDRVSFMLKAWPELLDRGALLPEPVLAVGAKMRLDRPRTRARHIAAPHPH